MQLFVVVPVILYVIVMLCFNCLFVLLLPPRLVHVPGVAVPALRADEGPAPGGGEVGRGAARRCAAFRARGRRIATSYIVDVLSIALVSIILFTCISYHSKYMCVCAYVVNAMPA